MYTHVSLRSTKTLLTNYLPNHVDRLCCDILHATAIKGMIQILIMCSYINKDKKRHRKVFTYHTAGVIAKRRAIQTSLPACAYLIKVNINFPKITFCFDPRFKFSVVFLVVWPWANFLDLLLSLTVGQRWFMGNRFHNELNLALSPKCWWSFLNDLIALNTFHGCINKI